MESAYRLHLIPTNLRCLLLSPEMQRGHRRALVCMYSLLSCILTKIHYQRNETWKGTCYMGERKNDSSVIRASQLYDGTRRIQRGDPNIAAAYSFVAFFQCEKTTNLPLAWVCK